VAERACFDVGGGGGNHLVERNTGEVTGDGRLQVEGRADEVKSNVKQTGEKAEDAFRGRGTRRREYRVQGF
jgi:uncharacterized protein YjbJ (UPF0337 family)